MATFEFELSDDEREALMRFLRDAIERDRFPLSPRLAPIRAILAKLAPPSTPPAPPAERNPIVPQPAEHVVIGDHVYRVRKTDPHPG